MRLNRRTFKEFDDLIELSRYEFGDIERRI